VAPVEHVHHGADDERERGEHEVLLQHEHRGHQVQDEPGERDRIGGQTRLDQAVPSEGAQLAGTVATAGARASAPGWRAELLRAHAVTLTRRARQAQAPGRARASASDAAIADTTATSAPSAASIQKWLA